MGTKELTDDGVEDISAQDMARDDELAVLESAGWIMAILDVEAVEAEGGICRVRDQKRGQVSSSADELKSGSPSSGTPR